MNKLGLKIKTDYEKKEIGFWEGLIKGSTLGVVWTPCSAPLAGSVITFSARSIPWTETVFLNLAYVIGFGVPLVLMFIIGEQLVQKSRFVLVYHEHIQRFIGLFMILVAVAVCTHFDKVISSKILDLIPSYSLLLDNLQMRIM